VNERTHGVINYAQKRNSNVDKIQLYRKTLLWQTEMYTENMKRITAQARQAKKTTPFFMFQIPPSQTYLQILNYCFFLLALLLLLLHL